MIYDHIGAQVEVPAETKLVFNGYKLSVGAWVFPTGERARELCIAMSDGYEIGSFSITSYLH